ncbi:hypothetical protein SYNPS1DRAFT_25154 [Syncephalis pseudoplumigaleata]|uniref:CBS domain-containing protein n=1 Tax=Syncephalis pseudoplumigaleata TaxID=1712513 RepID=A0A4P9YSJ0_9FUNG|nr:hypothetical protein SYNPS1DRAFT_25154 [Syncephalis pseudoplumigaleata]|eukprot:RKP22913.1 hypothetical protein SYNPS1DRAFT_25154 [Syncephalis pseudoplumigaleata]
MSTHTPPLSKGGSTRTATASPSISSDFRELLKTTSVHQLLLDKKNAIPLVALPATASIEDVLDRLLAEDVLSVPIYTSTTSDDNDTRYIGLVSAYDLLVYLSNDLDFDEDVMAWIEDGSHGSAADRLARDLQQPVLRVVEQLDLASKVVTVAPDDSVQTLLALLTRHGQHHAIVQASRTSTSAASYPLPCMISQTDLGRFLTQHFHQLGRILDWSVEETASHRPSPHRPVTVPVNTTAGAVFRQLSMLLASDAAPNEGGGALAVVDDMGSMVAECSAAELRGLNPARMDTLRRPILVYLRERAGGQLPRPYICWPNYTLTQCLAGMVRLGVRRAWLVDDAGVPRRVVTLSDVLRLFAPSSTAI